MTTPIDFLGSERGSVGLEWELALVERDTLELSGRAGELLAALGVASGAGSVVGEYLASMVEIVSDVHTSVPDAVAEVRGHLARIVEVADGLGLQVLASGTHPFTRATTVPVVGRAQYDVVRERNAYWGRRMIICGTHVHVGVPDRDAALPLVHGLAALSPLLLGLSASSPYFEGEDTGFASQRTMLFQQLPTNGLPPEVPTWSAFEDHVASLMAVGMVSRPTEIRWDVRPAPKFGTVEVRVPDASPTLSEFACVSAWTQCLTEHCLAEITAGRALPVVSPWFVRENKWRTARYGLDAELITGDGVVGLRALLGHWLERLLPIADRLGCAQELSFAQVLLDHGTSAERQRAVASASGSDLRAVVRSVVAETRSSLDG